MQTEAIRYLQNAKQILKQTSIENNFYKDRKPVREAFGTTYLAILEAINAYLLRKGLHEKELPQSVEAYREALQKHVSVHNGKLLKEFDMLYRALHIAGYYRGLIYNVDAVKGYFKAAQSFIDRLEKTK